MENKEQNNSKIGKKPNITNYLNTFNHSYICLIKKSLKNYQNKENRTMK